MVRFGNILFQESGIAPDFNTIKKIALLCEKSGFDSIWLSDHLFPGKWYAPRASIGSFVREPVLECWTTLSALSTTVRSLRLGTLVLCNSYRYPSLLAKMSATLDVISGGRLELGLGAGWYEAEHLAYGIPFQKMPVRILRLAEAINIIKKMWTDEEATFEGKYYSVKSAVCNPKPIQKPGPPILIGGQSDRLLRVVAMFADFCNFWALTPEECERKFRVLEHYCKEVRRDPRELKKSWSGTILIAEREDELRDRVRILRAKHILEKSNENLILMGTPEQCAEKISKYIEIGVTYFIIAFPDVTDTESLQLFAEYVMPKFKHA